MKSLSTSADIAKQIGCTRDSLTRVARKHGVGERIGRDWLFTAAESARLATLVQDRVGAPSGNQFWRKRKSLKKPQ